MGVSVRESSALITPDSHSHSHSDSDSDSDRGVLGMDGARKVAMGVSVRESSALIMPDRVGLVVVG